MIDKIEVSAKHQVIAKKRQLKISLEILEEIPFVLGNLVVQEIT